MSKGSSWISATQSVLDGVKLINQVDEKKFPLVLNRIVQSIQTSNDELRPFTEDEEDKLLSTLDGVENKNDLKNVLDTSTFILLQAAYSVTKPAVLQKDLIEVLQMSEIKAEIFFTVWTSSAKGIVDNLRQKSIHNVQLDGLSWMLNISAASSNKTEKLEPRAVIELKLKKDDSSGSSIVMDVNHSQLFQLYNTLENIQSELDNLR